jgi:hypothetical protein
LWLVHLACSTELSRYIVDILSPSLEILVEPRVEVEVLLEILAEPRVEVEFLLEILARPRAEVEVLVEILAKLPAGVSLRCHPSA